MVGFSHCIFTILGIWFIGLQPCVIIDLCKANHWQIFLVAENKVLRINPLNIGTSESAVEVFFGSDPGEEGSEIIGISVSTLSSSLFINVKKRGLFAYRLQGQLSWTTGPVLYQSGYRQGCRKNDIDCYFASTPVIDQCEASIYVWPTHP